MQNNGINSFDLKQTHARIDFSCPKEKFSEFGKFKTPFPAADRDNSIIKANDFIAKPKSGTNFLFERKQQASSWNGFVWKFLTENLGNLDTQRIKGQNVKFTSTNRSKFAMQPSRAFIVLAFILQLCFAGERGLLSLINSISYHIFRANVVEWIIFRNDYEWKH